MDGSGLELYSEQLYEVRGPTNTVTKSGDIFKEK